MSRKARNHSGILLVLFLVATTAWLLYGGWPPSRVSANSGGGGTSYSLALTIEGGGSVRLDPPDTVYSSNTSRSYAGGTQVTLEAIDVGNWVFDHWEGDLSGTGKNRTITMSSSKEVTAVFVLPTLVVHKEGSGQVHVDPPDETLVPTFTKTYALNQTVSLTAIPASGWAFDRWTGDRTGTSETTSIQVSGRKEVTAVFEQIKLTVLKEGQGQVTLSPPGVTPTLPHTESYDDDTTVSLTAVPATGWAFKEWTGDKTGTSESTSIYVDGSKSVTAVFEQVSLTVDKVGSGQVTVNPPNETQALPHTWQYDGETTVSLTATPDAGWSFKEWTGDLTSTSSSASMTVDDTKSVTAVFEQIILTVQSGGPGSVTIDPPNETRPVPFTEAYAADTSVSLTAVPDTGWIFKEWQGDVTGTSPTATVTMDGPKTVKPIFELINLHVTREGYGSVHVDPPDETHTEFYFVENYEYGEQVSVTALSSIPGWHFKEWTGDVESTNETITVQMDGRVDITAVFEEIELSVARVGQGRVRVTPPDETLLPPFTRGYDADEVVTLEAIPDPGWGFQEWTGDLTGTSAITTITMDEAKSVTAVFFPIKLNVTKEGQGWVNITPPDALFTPPVSIDCEQDEVRTLEAIPMSGWGFKEWTGDATGTSLTTTVTMDGTKNVEAVFAQAILSVASEGAGQVHIDPPDETRATPFNESYPWGEEVSVTAVPAEGWGFKEWTGSVTRGEEELNPLPLDMDGNRSVTAVFEQVVLTVTKTGNGDVRVTPPGETDTPPFSKTYGYGENVTLTAIPAAALDHWEGDLGSADPNSSSITIPMYAARTINAVFKPEYTLTMAKVGGGSVTPNVGSHTYREGETASLSASGNDSWIFDHWTGDATGTNSSTSVSMDGNKSATAHFIEGVKITVEKEGQGTVSPGTAVYPKGGTKTFTATPSAGWRWDRWEGDLAGADPHDPSLTIPLDQARTITAFFIEQVTLNVSKNLIGNLPANGGTLSPVEDVEHIYDIGTEVNLSAVADTGWRFKEWTGAVNSTNPNPPVLVMDGDKNVTGTFVQRHTITTDVIYRGEVDPEGGVYDHGQTVTFEWDSEQTFCFCMLSHWSGLPDSFTTAEWGVGTSENNPVTFTVDQDYDLIAHAESTFVTLTANLDAPDCFDCTVEPEAPQVYVRDYEGTATATPGDGWIFVEWTGDDVPAGKENDNPLTLTMDENKTVTAVMIAEYDLTATVDAEGCTGCAVDPEFETYLNGETATVAATAPTGWVFVEWTGDVPVEDAEENPLNLAMNNDRSVTAVYGVQLSVDKNGEGQVAVDPPGGVQALPYTEVYDGDTSVTLTATADLEWVFTGWSGSLSGTTNPATLVLNAEESVTAEFESLSVSLSVEDDLTECMEGRELTYTATVSDNFPVSASNLATFTFYFRTAAGAFWSKEVKTDEHVCQTTAVAGDVAHGDSDHMFSTPILVEVESADGVAYVDSSILWMDVYELWIEYVRDKESGIDWQVVVGESIAYSAIGSSDCANWYWNMPEGNPKTWNPTGGNQKSGEGMVIPTTDMPIAEDWDHFGTTFGKVTVSCLDGDGNVHSISSHDLGPAQDAKVFFDPGGTQHPPDDQSGQWASQSNTVFPTKNWFYYWRAALFPDVEEFYYGTDATRYPGYYSPYRGIVSGAIVIIDAGNPNFAKIYEHFPDVLSHNWSQNQVNYAENTWGFTVERLGMEGKSGIDFFYAVATHELKHRSDNEDLPLVGDGDSDNVQDNVDPFPTLINGMQIMEYHYWNQFDWSLASPTNRPSPSVTPFTPGLGDKEWNARQAEGVTAPGNKDWSKGGKQW